MTCYYIELCCIGLKIYGYNGYWVESHVYCIVRRNYLRCSWHPGPNLPGPNPTGILNLVFDDDPRVTRSDLTVLSRRPNDRMSPKTRLRALYLCYLRTVTFFFGRVYTYNIRDQHNICMHSTHTHMYTYVNVLCVYVFMRMLSSPPAVDRPKPNGTYWVYYSVV